MEPFTLDGGPGRHDVLRGVVETWLGTRAVHTMEPLVRHSARELIVEIGADDGGAFDLASELAYRRSMRVLPARRPRTGAGAGWPLLAKRLVNPEDELLGYMSESRCRLRPPGATRRRGRAERARTTLRPPGRPGPNT